MNKGYSYQIGICKEIHDDFVKKSAQANLLQSSQGSKVKNEWENERLAFFQDNRLVGVASVLIRRLTPILPFTMLYIPRGPIIDYEDSELVCFVLETLVFKVFLTDLMGFCVSSNILMVALSAKREPSAFTLFL